MIWWVLGSLIVALAVWALWCVLYANGIILAAGQVMASYEICRKKQKDGEEAGDGN